MHNTPVLWYFDDGKPGHYNQILGLIQALKNKISLSAYPVRPLKPWQDLFAWIKNVFPHPHALPAPTWVIGAGHHTHFSLLAAKRAYGAKAIVLMRPSLPLFLFDLCIIPEHDGPLCQKNVLLTKGALNCVNPSTSKHSSEGLILIGGPSDHFVWDDALVLKQISTLIQKSPHLTWTLTTSRRTPNHFLSALPASFPALIVPYEKTSHNWLLTQLNDGYAQIWLTPDSVSMLYEALSSTAMVCVFSLHLQTPNTKVAKNLERLILDGSVYTFEQLEKNIAIKPNRIRLNESMRASEWILSRWL